MEVMIAAHMSSFQAGKSDMFHANPFVLAAQGEARCGDSTHEALAKDLFDE